MYRSSSWIGVVFGPADDIERDGLMGVAAKAAGSDRGTNVPNLDQSSCIRARKRRARPGAQLHKDFAEISRKILTKSDTLTTGCVSA